MKKKKTNKTALSAGAAVGVAALAVAGVAIAKKLLKKGKQPEVLELPYEDTDVQEIRFSYTENTKLSFDEAYAVALEAAKKQFGESAVIVPASEKKALNVTIDGERRACFMFGADRAGTEGGAMEGLYHVDGNTGEVFDNGKGEMTKLI